MEAGAGRCGLEKQQADCTKEEEAETGAEEGESGGEVAGIGKIDLGGRSGSGRSGGGRSGRWGGGGIGSTKGRFAFGVGGVVGVTAVALNAEPVGIDGDTLRIGDTVRIAGEGGSRSGGG